MMHHFIILIIAGFFMFGFGLVILDNINDSLDLNIIIQQIKTNQTYVDNLNCIKILQMSNLLESPLNTMDHSDELIYELQIIYDEKHCESEIQK
jgi:hypothetical protein